ncbi:MAG: MoxR family ATPase [Gemmatimonadaceae bacterium]
MATNTPSTTQPQALDDSRDLELLGKLSVARKALLHQIGRKIIGQQEVIENLIAAVLAGGHVVIVGVPGLAKTMLVQTLSEALDLSFSRVQFTPDLMPGDITGTELLEEDHATGRRVFKFVKGPVFANVVLADEINRAPPKTQSALLQAMQERTVTVAGQTHKLPTPFFVLATQNPIEQEATYPLPEAQLDRFMFQLNVGYPSFEEEERIVTSTTGAGDVTIQPVLSGQEVLELQQLVRRMPAPPSLVKFAVALARSTRPSEPDSHPEIRKYISYGTGPRASQYLILGAKARAAMDGRPVPDLDDIRAIAQSVLSHRIVMNFQAEAEGVGPERLVALVVKK